MVEDFRKLVDVKAGTVYSETSTVLFQLINTTTRSVPGKRPSMASVR